MPDNDTMTWILGLLYWIEWYEHVQGEIQYHASSVCPDSIKDEPILFKQWVKSQQNKTASPSPYKT